MKVDGTKLVSMITKSVADAYGVPSYLIFSERRSARVYQPRAISAFIAHKIVGIPAVEVGRALGRDHSTILHACGVAERMMARDEATSQIVKTVSEAAMKLKIETSDEYSVQRLLAAYFNLTNDEKVAFLAEVSRMQLAEKAA